eukprot:scaffold89866_cov56-Phaeocystis_antarctica.AAC.3
MQARQHLSTRSANLDASRRVGDPSECAKGCSGTTAYPGADERGGAAAGAGGRADAARGREQGGLLRRVPLQSRSTQALQSRGEARRVATVPRTTTGW